MAGALAGLPHRWSTSKRACALLAEYRHLAAKPAELAMAFYFHDAVYDPFLPDNEERSAALAAGTLGPGRARRASWPPGSATW